MTASLPYFDLIRQMKNSYSYRVALLDYARAHGIKAVARTFQTTVPTVRKWLRRFQAQGLKGLQALSRAPHSCPHKITGPLSERVVELRRQLPTFSAQRLRREFDLPVSPGTAYRIWREHGLVPRRRRKYQKKQDLAALKETWALFQQISADTKDLDDIPSYWPQMKARALPALQYTAREVRSGLQFLTYAKYGPGLESRPSRPHTAPQHDRGVQVQLHDIADIFDKQWVTGQLKSLSAMGLELKSSPDAADSASAHPTLPPQGARAPVRGILGSGF